MKKQFAKLSDKEIAVKLDTERADFFRSVSKFSADGKYVYLVLDKKTRTAFGTMFETLHGRKPKPDERRYAIETLLKSPIFTSYLGVILNDYSQKFYFNRPDGELMDKAFFDLVYNS